MRHIMRILLIQSYKPSQHVEEAMYVPMQATATEQRHLSYIKSACGNLDVLRHSPNALQPAPSLSCRVENQRQQGISKIVGRFTGLHTGLLAFATPLLCSKQTHADFVSSSVPVSVPVSAPVALFVFPFSWLVGSSENHKVGGCGVRTRGGGRHDSRRQKKIPCVLRTAATIAADKKDRAVGAVDPSSSGYLRCVRLSCACLWGGVWVCTTYPRYHGPAARESGFLADSRKTERQPRAEGPTRAKGVDSCCCYYFCYLP